jgi:hypothetical protein
MSEAVREVLSGIQTVEDMIAAFSDEQQCRRLRRDGMAERSDLSGLRL